MEASYEPLEEISQYCTLLSKQGQRREKTLTEREGTQTTRVTPPPSYLLKLSWFGRGPTGPSFTPSLPLLHTQKQHAVPEVSCRGRLNMYILNWSAHAHAQDGGK